MQDIFRSAIRWLLILTVVLVFLLIFLPSHRSLNRTWIDNVKAKFDGPIVDTVIGLKEADAVKFFNEMEKGALRDRVHQSKPGGFSYSLAGLHHICGFTFLYGLLLTFLLIAIYIPRYQKTLFAFLVRRFALMVVSLIGITMVTFTIIRLAPGDPTTMASGLGSATGGEGIDPSQMAREIEKTQKELLGILIRYDYTATASDPDGDDVAYIWSWGDGTGNETTRDVPSGKSFVQIHSWPGAGDYEIRVKARDPKGAESDWSEPLLVRVREGSLPPKAPDAPTGPVSIVKGEKHSFQVTASGHKGEPVLVHFDWGDGTGSSVEKIEPGSAVEKQNDWPKSGLYPVRVRCVGPKNSVSKWSEPLWVAVYDKDKPYAIPTKPELRANALPGEKLTLSSRSSSKSGKPFAITFRILGPDRFRENIASKPVKPGETASIEYTFKIPGKYRILAYVKTAEGASSASEVAGMRILKDNRPPGRPDAPTGPTDDLAVHTSLLQQYGTWMVNLVQLKFGKSLKFNKDVFKLIWYERLPNTLILNGLAILLVYIVAVPIGIFSSTHRHSLADKSITVVLFMFYSLPSFWVATMLVVLVTTTPQIPIFGLSCDKPITAHYTGAPLDASLLLIVMSGLLGFLTTKIMRTRGIRAKLAVPAGILAVIVAGILLFKLPRTGSTATVMLFVVSLSAALFGMIRRPEDEKPKRPALAFATTALITCLLMLLSRELFKVDLFWHLLLPLSCLTYGGLAALSRYARSGMLEVVRQDYIRTARAKGLSERVVIFKHALRNGMIPILTLFANILPYLIGGSIIIEYIFSIDGMGSLIIVAIQNRDYNVIMAETTFVAVMTLVGILVSDILYVLVDPRISFEKLDV